MRNKLVGSLINPFFLIIQLQGTHGTGKTGKMANKNSLQGKLREFENFAELRESSGNLNLIFFLIC